MLFLPQRRLVAAAGLGRASAQQLGRVQQHHLAITCRPAEVPCTALAGSSSSSSGRRRRAASRQATCMVMLQQALQEAAGHPPAAHEKLSRQGSSRRAV